MATCHPEQARNRAVTAMQYGIFPRASKFCFLKLPIVFGYAVPFTAISKKQNRKGSPQNLIYPLKGKLTFFMIKQFFSFKKEHQTLSRSRLRRFLPLSAALHQPKKNSLPVFLVGGIPLSMHHTQCADFDCKNFDVRGDDCNT